MSAYIVEKNHILYLIAAARCRSLGLGSFYWRHDGQGLSFDGTEEQAAEVGNMLWLENIKSVSARYPNESSATLPGTEEESSVITPADMALIWNRIEAVQVLKACDCFEYQSCEHQGWESSEACAFIDSLRRRAAHAVPGYDKAEWGAPKPYGSPISIMSLCAKR